MVRPLLPALLALTLLAAACSDDSDALGPTATVGTAPSTTTVPPDPFAVPAAIDAAYVERVTNKLYEVIGEARRLTMQQGATPPEAIDRLRAAYHPSLAQPMIDALVFDLYHGFPAGLDGDLQLTVKQVVRADQECIVAATEMDASLVDQEAGEPYLMTTVLLPLDPALDKGGYNPTPWSILRASASTPTELGGSACE